MLYFSVIIEETNTHWHVELKGVKFKKLRSFL